jgi:AcrR family transcriptional regulator
MGEPRKQAERSAATRAALIAAARELFGERGYAGVGTTELADAAGVTRGALYHQFADKRELFATVFESVEQDLIERIAARIAEAGPGDPLGALAEGAEVLIDAALEPDFRQIAAVDAPGVLGWEEWRRVSERYGLGLIVAGIGAAIDEGSMAEQPVDPIAHLLLGALNEGAMYVARAEQPERARRETLDALRAMLSSLARYGPG